jgi:hypothetical protein
MYINMQIFILPSLYNVYTYIQIHIGGYPYMGVTEIRICTYKCMYVCISMWICMYILVHKHLCIYSNNNPYNYIHRGISVYGYSWDFVCWGMGSSSGVIKGVRVCMYVCIYICIWVYTYMSTSTIYFIVYMINIHTHIFILRLYAYCVLRNGKLFRGH